MSGIRELLDNSILLHKKALDGDKYAAGEANDFLTDLCVNKYRELLTTEKVDITYDQKEVRKHKKSLEEIVDLHFRTFTGDSSDLLQAYESIQEAYDENPDDPVIAAFYADYLSLTGRDSADAASIFGNAIKAIRKFDELVEKNPDILEVRLLRACHSYRLPDAFFKRMTSAVNDFEYLIEAYENGGCALSREMYFKLLFILGKAYWQLGLKDETDRVWKKLLDSGCGMMYRKLVDKHFSEEAGVPGQEPVQAAGTAGLTELELFRKAKRLHDAALDGNKRVLKEATDILKKLFEAHPDVPIIEGYYGSCIALSGKYASEVQELFGSAIKGSRHLNHAVDSDPGNINLRYLRAGLFGSLPEAFFHLGENALEDFNHIIKAYEKDKTILSKEKVSKVLYQTGICCKRLDKHTEAVDAWKKLMEVNPESEYVKLIGKI